MGAGQLFTLSMRPVALNLQRWWIRRQLANERRNEEFFSDRIAHDTAGLKEVHYRQAHLQAMLRDIK